MKKPNIALLGVSGNYAVVLLEGRQYPAAALQGDSLKILYDCAVELQASLNSDTPEDVRFSAREISEKLEDMIRYYEEVCDQQNTGLPYRS